MKLNLAADSEEENLYRYCQGERSVYFYYSFTLRAKRIRIQTAAVKKSSLCELFWFACRDLWEDCWKSITRGALVLTALSSSFDPEETKCTGCCARAFTTSLRSRMEMTCGSWSGSEPMSGCTPSSPIR